MKTKALFSCAVATQLLICFHLWKKSGFPIMLLSKSCNICMFVVLHNVVLLLVLKKPVNILTDKLFTVAFPKGAF